MVESKFAPKTKVKCDVIGSTNLNHQRTNYQPDVIILIFNLA
jgi:hypothetical protein